MTLRIGVITDIHNAGPEGVSLPLVEQFVEEMTERFRPDLVVDLGDRIADVDAEVDAGRIRQVTATAATSWSSAIRATCMTSASRRWRPCRSMT